MEKVLQTWLDHQCRMLSGSRYAMLLTVQSDQGPDNRVLFWPDEPRDHAMLSHVARVALRDKKPVIKPLSTQGDKTGESRDVVACPLFLEKRLLGVVAFEMTHRSLSRLRAVVQQVQAGARWLEAMVDLSLEPALASKKRDQRASVKLNPEPVQSRWAKCLGPQFLPLKVGAGLTAVLLVGFFLISILLRTPSESASQAINRHKVVAPQQGNTFRIQVDSGDAVGHGAAVKPDGREPPIQELNSIEVGPVIGDRDLKKASSILHNNGLEFQQAAGVKTVMVTRLLEGLYTRDQANKRFKEIQKIVDSPFILSEKGKFAIYVATYHDQKRANQRIKQLAQKNIKVTAVTSDLQLKGTILVVKNVDGPNRQTITDQMSKIELSVKVGKPE